MGKRRRKKKRIPKPKKKQQASKDQVKLPRSLVDIVIPVFGHAPMLRGTIASLRLHPSSIPWKCLIVDDASPEEDREELDGIYKGLAKDRRFRVIKSKKNLGFAGANNKGVASGSSQFILLLNSDIRVTGDWLALLVKEMHDPKVGVVGSRLLFFPERFIDVKRPAGKIQHAGVIFNIENGPYHRMIGWPPDDIRVMRKQEFQAVTGACFLTRRSLWNKIRGLNTVYTKGNFEDVEFALYVGHLGYKVIYTPEPLIYHFGGGSENYQTATQNLQIFLMRCGNVAKFDDYLHGRMDGD